MCDVDIKIVVNTNHNTFDLEQYKILCEVVKGNCLVWARVEIDVLGPDSKRWHLLSSEFREAVSLLQVLNSFFKMITSEGMYTYT